MFIKIKFAVLCLMCLVFAHYLLQSQNVEIEITKDCDTCPDLVTIPSGSVMIGSTVNEIDRRKGERWGRSAVGSRDGAHYRSFMLGFWVAAQLN